MYSYGIYFGLEVALNPNAPIERSKEPVALIEPLKETARYMGPYVYRTLIESLKEPSRYMEP